MKRSLYALILIASLMLILSISYSCNKIDKTNDPGAKQAEIPTSGKPTLVPVIDQTQLQSMNEFNPSTGNGNKYKSTDEVYGSSNDRSYAYNECNNAKISYFIYGGNSEDKTSGRWFYRQILKWDASGHVWKTFFSDGVNFNAQISDDVTLQKGAWYYTVQWVWDPAAKTWIKFNADLLVQV